SVVLSAVPLTCSYSATFSSPRRRSTTSQSAPVAAVLRIMGLIDAFHQARISAQNAPSRRGRNKMDAMQKRMLEERLQSLLDILNQIGPEFSLPWADSEGNIWSVDIKLQERNQ